MTSDDGDGTAAPRKTDGVEKWLRNVRLLGDADDPLFFVGICVVAVVTIVALLVSLLWDHAAGHELRDVILKLAGGVLIMLGAYTAVRTIISNRANGASQAFTSILAVLATDGDTSEAARVGAIRHLPDLARRRGADAPAIAAVIDALLKHDPPPDAVTAAAEEARREFPEEHERRTPDHRPPAWRSDR
jgi:hypothetical protein